MLGFLPLLAMVVGAIVGAGIYNAPADLAGKANPGWIVVAWMVTGAGLHSLVSVFRYLARRRPDLDGGIYRYARAAAGEFAGFQSAYGYWWSSLFTNLAYFFIIVKVLGHYLPVLATDRRLGLALASALLWSAYFLIRAGMRTAGWVNAGLTALKILPLLLVAGAAIVRFDPGLTLHGPFSAVLPGGAPSTAWQQVGSCLGVTVFAFLGIEGAVVVSARARRQRDVARATGAGFAIALLLYVLVSVFTLGAIPAAELAGAGSPLGEVLRRAMGEGGRLVLDAGFLLSVLGALLAWFLLAAETPCSAAAPDGAFPPAFGRTDRRATPRFALGVSAALSQLLLLLFYSTAAGRSRVPLLQNFYFAAINISVICALVPYSLAALLAIRQARRDREAAPQVHAAVCLALFAGMLAAMLRYAAVAMLVYASGAGLRLAVHRGRGRPMPAFETAAYLLLLAAGAVVLWMMGTDRLRF